ncbi:MAG: acyltransferase [Clostridia bacterium]|nr:acyltransferase [Clostridia bacterium]
MMKVDEKQELTENKQTNVKKRDISVELIRVVACLLVVAVHLSLQVFNQYYSQVDWSRLFEKCFFTDGVPLFFMITGFFIANGRSYKKTWKSVGKRILLPVGIYVLFAQIFYMFITNKQSIMWCLQNAINNLNLQGILRAILTGDVVNINSLCAHLWYIFSHIKIVIWMPVLWLICKNEDTPNLARRMIMGFGIFSFVIQDIQKFVVIPDTAIKIFTMVDPTILYVLFGYELFVNKDKIKKNKKLCVISLVLFVLANVAKYKLEMQYMVINNYYDIVGRSSFLEWKYTSLNIISSICLFMALYSFEIKSERFSKIISWLSDKTFGVYLVHYLLIAKVDLYKFDKLGKLGEELIYLALSITITFTASVIVVCILRKISDLIGKGFKKLHKIK